jgi:hypothetical protein
MKAFTTKTKTIAATTISLAALLTGSALAHSAIRHNTGSVDVVSLETHIVRSGDLPGFWSTECPIAETSAAMWAAGNHAEATALRAEGFVVGVREPLRSRSGATAASVALTFRSAAGATADLDRRERLAGHTGYATNFGAPELRAVRAYTVRTAVWTTVRVAYTRGSNEYAVEVKAAGRANAGALQRVVAAAARRLTAGG